MAKATIGKKALFPGFIEPALAKFRENGRPPSGDDRLHEVKFDGYRVQLEIANEGIKILTRRGHDWTRQFQKIATDAYLLRVKSAIIDGEVIAPGAGGVSDFSALQKRLRAKKAVR